MAEYKFLKDEHRDGVAVLTLSRPDRLNAYSAAMADEMHSYFDDLARDLDTRVLVITGAGRAFCAGLDIKEPIDDALDKRRGRVQARYLFQQKLASLATHLREIPQPVIAAVHGAAVGGGLALASAADIRIADRTARFNAAFIRIGLSAGDDGVSWFFPRIVGPSMAAELLYTGRFFDAQEALRIGFVSRVVPEGRVLDVALSIATEIVANSPFGIRMTKELLNVSLDAPGLRHVMEIENRTQVLCLLTEDFEEGLMAQVERRTALYRDH